MWGCRPRRALTCSPDHPRIIHLSPMHSVDPHSLLLSAPTHPQRLRGAVRGVRDAQGRNGGHPAGIQVRVPFYRISAFFIGPLSTVEILRSVCSRGRLLSISQGQVVRGAGQGTVSGGGAGQREEEDAAAADGDQRAPGGWVLSGMKVLGREMSLFTVIIGMCLCSKEDAPQGRFKEADTAHRNEIKKEKESSRCVRVCVYVSS